MLYLLTNQAGMDHNAYLSLIKIHRERLDDCWCFYLQTEVDV